MSRRRRVALWSLALVIAVVGDVGFLVYGAAPFGGNMAFEVSLDVAVGFATMAAGIVTWSRRPENRIGPMLFAAAPPGASPACTRSAPHTYTRHPATRTS
jgi:hypothetical protein